MKTAVSLFRGEEWFPIGVIGNLFSHAVLLVDRMVQSGVMTHGYCYTINDDFRIIDWHERATPRRQASDWGWQVHEVNPT